jgi:hypothetical protein
LVTKSPVKCIQTNNLTYLSVHKSTNTYFVAEGQLFLLFASNKSITSTLLLSLNLEGIAVEEWGEAQYNSFKQEENMNKQKLAAKIWASANQMRSKIEANEYKDYILGFIFYKYLSEKELQFAKKEDFTEADIKALSEEDTETVEHIKSNIGYFIAYDNLFSTWISMGKDFDVANVRDALSAFSRLISTAHKKLFDGIFDTLQTGLSKLGDSAASQTKAIRDLLHLIKDIPMDGRQDYDVLGFIYEYLIGMFAANAGKKGSRPEIVGLRIFATWMNYRFLQQP